RQKIRSPSRSKPAKHLCPSKMHRAKNAIRRKARRRRWSPCTVPGWRPPAQSSPTTCRSKSAHSLPSLPTTAKIRSSQARKSTALRISNRSQIEESRDTDENDLSNTICVYLISSDLSVFPLSLHYHSLYRLP